MSMFPDTKLQGALDALEALAATKRSWNGPRNLPKPTMRKKRRRMARDSRRRNRG